MDKKSTEKTVLRSIYINLKLLNRIENIAKEQDRSFNKMTIILLEKAIRDLEKKDFGETIESEKKQRIA